MPLYPENTCNAPPGTSLFNMIKAAMVQNAIWCDRLLAFARIKFIVCDITAYRGWFRQNVALCLVLHLPLFCWKKGQHQTQFYMYFLFGARFIERPGEISSIATSMSRIHPDDVTAAIVCQNTHFTLENCFKQTFKTWIHTAPDSLRLNRCRVTAQTI